MNLPLKAAISPLFEISYLELKSKFKSVVSESVSIIIRLGFIKASSNNFLGLYTTGGIESH